MLYPFRYAKQFERYIGQFMRVFSGFQTQDGVARDGSFNLKQVPVVYGGMSRIVASVIQKRGTLQNNRVPMIAVHMEGIEIDMERKRNHHHIGSIPYNDGSNNALKRIDGPAYNMRMSVSVYASSNSELFSIIEQILLIFNPRVAIQIDNSIENSDYITEIILDDIQKDIQYPLGSDKQVVMMVLNFSVPVRLRYPYDREGATIQQILLNIMAESQEGIEQPIDSVVIGDLPENTNEGT